MAYLQVFALAPDGQPETSLWITMEGQSPNACEADFDFSPDWKKAAHFRMSRMGMVDRWSSTTYCLTGHKHLECGNNPHIEAPPIEVKGFADGLSL